MDELMERYQKLSNRTTFNPETYPQEWRKLAEDFDKAGRPHMANGCYGKADWYDGKGYAQKLSYHEITPVQADYIWADPNEKMLPCAVCGTDTKHVRCSQGWACGCGEIVYLHENAGRP